MKKEYEVLKPGLDIAINIAEEITLADIQKCAEQEFGNRFSPLFVGISVAGHCLIVKNHNAYRPASKEALDQLLKFKLGAH